MKPAQRQQLYTLAVVTISASLCLQVVQTAAVHKKDGSKNSTSNNTLEETKICQVSMPCGWAIYVPFTRRIDHFILNTCTCEENDKCLNTDDDLSVSAYVYRCRRPTPADIAAGHDIMLYL